jgi:hypothetical protein
MFRRQIAVFNIARVASFLWVGGASIRHAYRLKALGLMVAALQQCANEVIE